ncbi:hypothetical protein SAY86_004997 [Trapa natans]|uniref:BAG family molecular chaperone regulator 4 n=1 Tax=Trapa natans TaxID=22666 RepID=A0AAN7L2N8_TRANT|nr:hypothetical protein SAY86_004997 [Trapa natans]
MMKSSHHQHGQGETARGTAWNQLDWEMRPSGMLVQRREDGAEGGGPGPMIRINVSYGSSHYEIFLPSSSSFGEMKNMLAQKCGLEPKDQRLFFRGKEKDDDENLQVAGLKDNSKMLLLECQASKERKLEQLKKAEEISKACEAVARVKVEVDKLSERVAALEVSVHERKKVSDKEFEISTELLMRLLLKLDGIEAEGEARLQRKAEVRRVQGFVDTLDSLKAQNSNPFSNRSNAASITTNWETFESGVGSLSAPPSASSASKVTKDWKQFE